MMTLEEIQNTEFDYITELHVKNGLDTMTVVNAFLKAVTNSQTTTKIGPDIKDQNIQITPEETIVRVAFSSSVAQSNCVSNTQKELAFIPKAVKNDLGISIKTDTIKYPKAKVA